MKKPVVSLSLFISSLTLIAGVALIGNPARDGASAPASVVYAVDIDGDGIDDGDVQEGGDDVDINYTGDIDIYTGLPVTSDETEQTGTTRITDTCYYDLNAHLFCFPAGGGIFCCSAADGMVTTSPVSFAKSGEFNVAVYKDGKQMNGIPQSVSEPGTYTAITWDENSELQLMSFRIVKAVTGVLAQFVVPDGFTVTEATLDGTELDGVFGIVDMTKNGYYDIKYTCNATGIAYSLVTTIDHTPPQIILVGVDKDNKAKGPVEIQGLQAGDSVSVLLDKKKANLKAGNKLTESGDYTVYVFDEAGNVTQKDFTIMLYLNIKSVFLFSAVILLIVGVFVALYITRKNLRVR